MRTLFYIFSGFLFITSLHYGQLTVKDQDKLPHILMQVNDEGTAGSITLYPISLISNSSSKLYNLSGDLFWDGIKLGTSDNAGGWMKNGSVIHTTTLNDYVGIGTTNPQYKLSIHAESGSNYIRVSDEISGLNSGLRMGMGGNGNAYIINDLENMKLYLGTNGNGKVTINSDGQVGINKTSPEKLLHLKQMNINKALRIEHETDSDYWENGIGTTTKSYKFYYNSVSKVDILASDGSYFQVSDLRMKKNIVPISGTLDKIIQLKPSTYNLIDSEDQTPKSIGFIAQEVERLFPELVRELDDGYKGLQYDGFAVLAIKAIQEQQNIIEGLKNRIELLENQNK